MPSKLLQPPWDGIYQCRAQHRTNLRPSGVSVSSHHTLGARRAEGAVRRGAVQVRHQKEAIDLPLIQEAIDKRELGLATARLPDTPAKRRLATVEAGRAVALALTPGIPPLERLTIAPRGPILSRLSFAHGVRPPAPRQHAGPGSLRLGLQALWQDCTPWLPSPVIHQAITSPAPAGSSCSP